MPTYYLKQTRMRPPLIAAADLFFDDFLGTTLDGSKWQGPFDRRGDPGTGEVQAMVPANVTIGSSLLTITSKHETVTAADRDEAPPHALNTGTAAGTSASFNYTSGQVMTVSPFLYGTITCRYKPPAGRGVWPLLWMLGSNWDKQLYTANQSGANWPVNAWCETDVAEFWQGVRTNVNESCHYQSADTLHLVNLPYDASTRFMVYRLQWSAGSMIWSVDPEDGSGFQTLRSISGAAVPAFAQYIVLSTAVGGNGSDAIVDADFPLVAQYDYVRVTQ